MTPLCANSPCVEGRTRFVKSVCLQKAMIARAASLCYNSSSKQSGPKYKYIVFYKMHLNIFNIFYIQRSSFMFCSGPKGGLSSCASPASIASGPRGCSLPEGNTGRDERGELRVNSPLDFVPEKFERFRGQPERDEASQGTATGWAPPEMAWIYGVNRTPSAPAGLRRARAAGAPAFTLPGTALGTPAPQRLSS